jgi:hypothetical protein
MDLMQKRDEKEIIREFRLRQSRQFLAIGITMLLLIVLTLFYKRPDFFGSFSKYTIFAAQLILIAAFIAFSVFNWRCPSCKKYLGNDIARQSCRQCKTRLR